MRIQTVAAAFVVAAAAAVLPLAGIASAQVDRDCPDFSTQAEAQAVLDADATDPERLDGDGDGYACESLFGEPTTQPTARPTAEPTARPTAEPTAQPTAEPTAQPTAEPTEEPGAEYEPIVGKGPSAGGEVAVEKAAGDTQIAAKPRGGVSTGDGSSVSGPLMIVLGIPVARR